ncbi:MAG: hypothetical protein JWR09_5429 [Mucilaginibacter sp.]|nr:hypothetical protein [Mucilaginibacter sp.]
MNKHLNDTEIQQYVLDSDLLSGPKLLHIENCEHCRLKGMQYKLIISGISTLPKMALDFDAAGLVMAKIEKPAPNPARFSPVNPVITTLILLGLAILGISAYSFYNIGLFKGSYILSLIAFILLLAGIADQYYNYLKKLEHIGLLK